ncbi:RipA family octameric membrane protein [Sediminimonas qiaohouensis]|uniref:RipA family octameric membrane protein n=1 Tax=Sediminimonas qiaohouensis TaxID=552061 RepID=UPI003CCBB427
MQQSHLSVNTLLVGSSAYLGAIDPDGMGIPVMPIAGMAICALWIMNITSYKTLNEAKFSVINAIEENFVEQPFHDEWKKLDPDQDGKRHRPFHKVEGVVPWIFIAVYLIQASTLIPWHQLVDSVCAST